MIKEILTAAGIPSRETRWVSKPPAEDYAIYMDDVTADGPDDENRIFTHDITVELYETKPNPKLEADLEAGLNAVGLKWSKQSRYWVPEAQRYQVIYEFTYITKT